MTKRALALLALVTAVTSVLVVVATDRAPRAAAVTGSDFTAGNLISNQVFYDSTSMTADQIQAFLNARYSGCNSGFVCLRDYTVTTPTMAPEASLCNGYAGVANEPAAQILAKIAQSCGVSPKALLVLIQKESGLITSKSPSYTQVTGYGCPDTTGCDANYYGFFNQVYLAARQFLRYRNTPTNYSYVAGRSNYILYNPNTACGGSQVYIQNQATAGLYDYTPYQPNAAALANLGGTGDSCSTYGNRNFWYMFSNWFGSTQSGGRPLLGFTADGTGYSFQNNVFATGQPYNVGSQDGSGFQQFRLLSAGDIDGDGTIDLLGVRPDGTLWDVAGVTSSTGVTFSGQTQIGNGWQGYSTVLATDISGDGHADILAVKADGTLWYYPNNSSTNPGHVPFTTGQQIGYGWSPFTHIVSADVNGDHRADILATLPDGTMMYYLNSLSGLYAGQPFSTGTVVSSGWQTFTSIAALDISGDGCADVAATKADGTLWYFPNNFASNPGGVPFTTSTQIGYGWQKFSLVL